MKASGFTDRQRRIVLLLVLIVVTIFALLAGLIITSLQNLERTTAGMTPSPGGTREVSPTQIPAAAPTRATTPVPEEGIWSQVRAARLFDQVAHQVETARGLTPRTEVPLSFLNDAEMTAMLRQRESERDLESELLPFTAVGLVPDGPVSVEVRPPVGIYVEKQEQLYVATNQPEGDGNAQTLLAHAYVHALQDQHFDLEAVSDRASTVDEELAAEALIEGDATLSTALYRYGDLGSVDWEQLSDMIVEVEHPQYGGALAGSEAWRRLVRFPNYAGRTFVQALFDSSGWDAVNRSYTDPPRSTEQVLHPTRYLEERDDPTRVVVPSIGHVLGEEWTTVVEETLGELVVGVYLSRTLPQEQSWDAAQGWDGDTLVIWEQSGGRRVLVWRTIWDSSGDAAEFENSLSTVIAQRTFPVRPVTPPRGLGGQWWQTGEGTFQVRRTARYVLLVQAPDLNTAVNVAGVLP